MFNLDRAAAYAARFGISRATLEAALRAGELAAGHSPAVGWIIGADDLESWCAAQV